MRADPLPPGTLVDLRPPLDSLARSPVETTAWSRAFQSTYGLHHRTRELRIGPAGSPDARVCLVEPSPGPRQLELAHLWEPGDLLARDATSLAGLAAALVGLRLPLRLSRLPRASGSTEAMAKAARGAHGLLLVRESIGSPSVPLRAGADPESVLNPGRRSDLRRARRRAERRGELTFDLVTPRLTELPVLLEETWRVEAASWKGAAGTALSADSARGRFFVRYLTLAARTHSVRVAFARLDGRAVATQLATVVDGRLWLFKIGFDQAVADCSPGHLLMLEVLRAAAGEGLSSVELMGRPEPWTQMWTQQVRPCVSVRYYPPHVASLPVLVDDVRHRWRMRSG